MLIVKIEEASMSVVIPWQAVRTDHERLPLKDNTEFSLIVLESGEKISIIGVDASQRGFGFIAKQELKAGKVYWLAIGSRRFSFEISHCESHLGIDNKFRCGGFIRDPAADVSKVLAELNLIV